MTLIIQYCSTINFIKCFRNLVTVFAKITQWEEGVTCVSLDITIYRLIILLVAKVTQVISYIFSTVFTRIRAAVLI